MRTLIELFNFGMMRKYDDILPDFDPKKLPVINLGPGNKHIDGAIELEQPEWDAEVDRIPRPDFSVYQIHAYHFLEHVQNIIPLMMECDRVLVNGGHMNIVVPHYKSQLSIEDVDHKRMFCEDTWKTMFKGDHQYKGQFNFKVKLNLLMGDSHNNLCLFTQLIKVIG